MNPIRRTIDELLSDSELFQTNEDGFGKLKDFLAQLILNARNHIDSKLDPNITVFERFLNEWIRILDLNENQHDAQSLVHKVKHRVTYTIRPGMKGLEEHIQNYSGLNSIRFDSSKPCHIKVYGIPFEEVDENRVGSAFEKFSRRESIIKEVTRVKPIYWHMEYVKGDYAEN